jgi:hypothetical protein
VKASGLPFLVQQFLNDAGWPAPHDPRTIAHMQTALTFFRAFFPKWINSPLDAKNLGYQKFGFNPFQLTSDGKPTNLTAAMQAIDFNQPVQRIELPKGKYLRRYGRPGEPRGRPPLGIWYTEKDVPASRLALPPDQSAPYGYELTVNAPALSCVAGDMLVDWNINPGLSRAPTQGVDYHYRAGGGLQYVVPNAAKVMRPL